MTNPKVILNDEQITIIRDANSKLDGDGEHDQYIILALMQSLGVYGDDVMYLYEYLVEADSDMRSEYDNDIDGFYEDQIPNQLTTIDETVNVLEEMLGYPSNQDYMNGLTIFEGDEDE